MSGFGERFRAAGYSVPKPLIEVDGKPIIQHVVEMFPGDNRFVFVCNRDHLGDPNFRMRETLQSLASNSIILAIDPHKLGPVHAVLQAMDQIDLGSPVIVNYADFTCRWDFSEFLSFVDKERLDGAVPAYRGFHPHSGGSTNYAYIEEAGGLLTAIREKQPFTADKTTEYASSGTYYFRTAELMRVQFLKQVQADVSVNGEYYVSSSFDGLAKEGKRVGVFPLTHFMQWGTPQDLDDYLVYSNLFTQLSQLGAAPDGISGIGSGIVLSGGESKRFFEAGYLLPKALLSLNGTTLLGQAMRQVPEAHYRSITWLDSRLDETIQHLAFQEQFKLDVVTGGQAESALHALGDARLLPEGPVTVLPNDSFSVDKSNVLSNLCEELSGEEWMAVWATPPNPLAKVKPEQFGWVWLDEEGDVASSVKLAPLSDEARVVTGTFTFSSAALYKRLFRELQSRDLKVKGEFYIDSMIEIAQSVGVIVRIFEPEVFVSLGTPAEYETYRYWQSCFDQWAGHPYSLDKDPNVDPGHVEKLRNELKFTLHSPIEQG